MTLRDFALRREAGVERRKLSRDELKQASEIIDGVKKRIVELSGDDKYLTFAYLRRVWVQLQYVERGKPVQRKRLKAKLLKTQGGQCAVGRPKHKLPERGAVLDRRNAVDGYVIGNVDLICPDCDVRIQTSLGYRAKPTGAGNEDLPPA